MDVTAATPISPDIGAIRAGTLRRAGLAAGAFALLSAGIVAGSNRLGPMIALGGYSDDPTIYRVEIGDNTLAVPGNAIRHAAARHDGPARRLDLYLRWPDMNGFTKEARPDFDDSRTPRLVFLGFEGQAMSRDMSGRLDPVYKPLLSLPGKPGPGETKVYDFKPGSNYTDETLVVLDRPGAEPLVARCLAEASGEKFLAPCERDIAIGADLSLTYRFPRTLLRDWPTLEAAVRGKAEKLLRRGK